MPKEAGPCRGYFPRWFYDSSKGMCKQFYYGGAYANFILSLLKKLKLKILVLNCFFNTASGRAIVLSLAPFAGCEGNKNNFEKYSQCKKQCEVMLRGKPVSPVP